MSLTPSSKSSPSLSLLYILMVGISGHLEVCVKYLCSFFFNTVYCKVASLLQRNSSHPSSAFNKQLILSWCGSIRTEETVCVGRNSGLSHLTTGTPDTLMNTHAFSDVCTKPNTHTRPYTTFIQIQLEIYELQMGHVAQRFALKCCLDCSCHYSFHSYNFALQSVSSLDSFDCFYCTLELFVLLGNK